MQGQGTISEVFGLMAGLVTLATIAFLVAHGGKTARIITASGNAFAKSVRAATLQK
jgi:hypothetical protein